VRDVIEGVRCTLARHILLRWQTTISVKEAEKMKCPKCQFNNPDDEKFCLQCGEKVSFVFA
jgi:predicted amidophosphoribosyltransferase